MPKNSALSFPLAKPKDRTMTTLNLLELAAALTAAQDAINAQANSQPEIDRLKATLNDKLDYITTLEADVIRLKREVDDKDYSINGTDGFADQIKLLRRERDEHGLEALSLRDELDTLKANIDKSWNEATIKFYDTMQTKAPNPKPVEHEHKPIEDVKPVELLPTVADSFTDPEPFYYSYDDNTKWQAWNKRRVDWNNKAVNDGDYFKIALSTNTTTNYSY